MDSPQRELAVSIVQKLREQRYEALFAGGCVRDLLLGREPKDYDVATTATPDQVRALFGRKRTLAVGASFGVIVVLGPQGVPPVEVATFRSEGPYLDGRRPESVSYCSPAEDALRRDFTINGMFYDPVSCRVYDYVGGERDLAARVIRAIGDPSARMEEGKLRLLRAVRFASVLDFEIDPTTVSAVREMASQLNVVSAERIAQELRRMLVDTHRRRAVQLCEDLGLLAVMLPEVQLAAAWSAEPSRRGAMLDLLQEPSFELALATLLLHLPARPTAHDICRRLKLSNDETSRTLWLIEHQTQLDHALNLTKAQLLRILSQRGAPELIALSRARLLAAGADLQPVLFCEQFIRETPPELLWPAPLVTGDDLVRHGWKPGPQFGPLLDQIRDAQLNGDITTTAEGLALARRLQPPGDAAMSASKASSPETPNV